MADKTLITGLKNLRNWGGRPYSTVETPNTSRSGSGTSTPTEGQIGEPLGPKEVHLVQNIACAGAPETAVTVPSHGNHPLPEKLGITSEASGISCENWSRNPSFAELCKIRDGFHCIVAGGYHDDTSEPGHIFPFELLEENKRANRITWRFIVILLGQGLRDKLVADLVSPKFGIHTPTNGLNLSMKIHTNYDLGSICLVPIEKSTSSPLYMDVRYIRCLPMGQTRLPVGYPVNPEDQYNFDATGEHKRNVESQVRLLNDGDIIRIAAADPEIPLPSDTLLFWHV
ncbi:hypothetical protein TWF481_008855 [Arthrobotrys musiformis]|uniref:HNH nuclease domain-containing protein n=1 Tax=Arthrobotrys musiformis TaxID=47236 RepID=A0AAV9WA56_9PEZI